MLIRKTSGRRSRGGSLAPLGRAEPRPAGRRGRRRRSTKSSSAHAAARRACRRVPLAITAFTGESLEARGIDMVGSMNAMAPNLSVQGGSGREIESSAQLPRARRAGRRRLRRRHRSDQRDRPLHDGRRRGRAHRSVARPAGHVVRQLRTRRRGSSTYDAPAADEFGGRVQRARRHVRSPRSAGERRRPARRTRTHEVHDGGHERRRLHAERRQRATSTATSTTSSIGRTSVRRSPTASRCATPTTRARRTGKAARAPRGRSDRRTSSRCRTASCSTPTRTLRRTRTRSASSTTTATSYLASRAAWSASTRRAWRTRRTACTSISIGKRSTRSGISATTCSSTRSSAAASRIAGSWSTSTRTRACSSPTGRTTTRSSKTPTSCSCGGSHGDRDQFNWVVGYYANDRSNKSRVADVLGPCRSPAICIAAAAIARRNGSRTEPSASTIACAR